MRTLAGMVSLTEFVLRVVHASAAETLADRDHVVLDASAWGALDARVARRGRRNTKVAELFERPSPFEE